MKQLFLGLISLAFVSACNNDSGSADGDGTSITTGTDTVGIATTADTAGMAANAAPLDPMDRNFVMKAMAGSMMEVELGNHAQQNASNQRVKDFGAMMVRDHSKANDELNSFASRRNIQVNTDSLMNLHKSHIDGLKNKKGKEFDRAYMSMMVTDHQKDVSEYEKASKMCKDQECLGFAAKTLPVLRMHLDSAQAINKAKM